MMPILLDGPMGTELNRRGLDTTLPLWSARALLEAPNIVALIHSEYLQAGAEVITTNTFRTQQYVFQKAGVHDRSEELTLLAVQLAKKAIVDTKARVAGSVAPVEDCYSPQLVPESKVLYEQHMAMLERLYSNGIDLFLVETMNSIREVNMVLDLLHDANYQIPVWLSCTANQQGDILSGESWSMLRDAPVDVILVNCSSIPSTNLAIDKLIGLDIPWGAYPNFGTIDPIIGWHSGLDTETFETFCRQTLLRQPQVIGTCCGATPTETQKLQVMIGSSNIQ